MIISWTPILGNMSSWRLSKRKLCQTKEEVPMRRNEDCCQILCRLIARIKIERLSAARKKKTRNHDMLSFTCNFKIWLMIEINKYEEEGWNWESRLEGVSVFSQGQWSSLLTSFKEYFLPIIELIDRSSNWVSYFVLKNWLLKILIQVLFCTDQIILVQFIRLFG